MKTKEQQQLLSFTLCRIPNDFNLYRVMTNDQHWWVALGSESNHKLVLCVSLTDFWNTLCIGQRAGLYTLLVIVLPQYDIHGTNVGKLLLVVFDLIDCMASLNAALLHLDCTQSPLTAFSSPLTA